MTKEEARSNVMCAISLALKDPILQQGFECICKENAELKKENEELKKENAAFKETLEFQQSCTMDRYFKLKKAKKMIRNLLYVYQLGKNELATARVREEAEEFLKEVGE